jgi:hypothetical protein
MKREMRIFLSFVFPLFSSKTTTTLFKFFTAKKKTEEICARNKDTYLFETRETFEREKRERERERTHARQRAIFIITERRKEKRYNMMSSKTNL